MVGVVLCGFLTLSTLSIILEGLECGGAGEVAEEAAVTGFIIELSSSSLREEFCCEFSILQNPRNMSNRQCDDDGCR